jgi:sphingomyelin phosphodiesterase acid-like 3
MKRQFILSILLLCFSQHIAAQARATAKFLTIADVHFTPFASCTTVKLGACQLITQLRQAEYPEWERVLTQATSQQLIKPRLDTNYVLLKSSLQEIKATIKAEHPRFILLLGDVLAHHFREQYILYSHDTSMAGYRSFVKKTLQFLTAEIQQAAPDIDVYPVLGNNDSYNGDYHILPQGDFLQDTTNTWAALIKNTKNQQRFRKDFPAAGYYAVDVPNGKNQRIIILDTVLFSSHAKKTVVEQAAQAQLVWLHEQLKQAASQQQKVWIAYHIPDGIDVFKAIKKLRNGIVEFWRPEYSQALQAELRAFPGVVTAILPGHIHMDSFQILTLDKTHQIPISITPSISPIFGNNPGFKVYSYDTATLQLKDFETYFYPLDNQPQGWHKEYHFNQVFQANCKSCELVKGMQMLQPANELAKYFKDFYAVGNNAQPITRAHDWLPYYWCGIHSLSRLAYVNCIKHKLDSAGK